MEKGRMERKEERVENKEDEQSKILRMALAIGVSIPTKSNTISSSSLCWISILKFF